MSISSPEQVKDLTEFYDKQHFLDPRFYTEIVARVLADETAVASTEPKPRNSPPPVVLAPGSFLSPDYLDPIGIMLKKHGAPVISLDYQKYPPKDKSPSLSDYITDSYRESLQNSHGKINIVGHSLGTIISSAVDAVGRGLQHLDPTNLQRKNLDVLNNVRIAGGPPVVGPKEMMIVFKNDPKAMFNIMLMTFFPRYFANNKELQNELFGAEAVSQLRTPIHPESRQVLIDSILFHHHEYLPTNLNPPPKIFNIYAKDDPFSAPALRSIITAQCGSGELIVPNSTHVGVVSDRITLAAIEHFFFAQNQ